MHLVLRSTVARGAFSFTRNRKLINKILAKHSKRSGIQLLGLGNAGNHLHLRVQIPGRRQYCRFIRAVTGEIALKLKSIEDFYSIKGLLFWDLRPFSSIIAGGRYLSAIITYLKINHLEGHGYSRAQARQIVEKWRAGPT